MIIINLHVGRALGMINCVAHLYITMLHCLENLEPVSSNIHMMALACIVAALTKHITRRRGRNMSTSWHCS